MLFVMIAKRQATLNKNGEAKPLEKPPWRPKTQGEIAMKRFAEHKETVRRMH